MNGLSCRLHSPTYGHATHATFSTTLDRSCKRKSLVSSHWDAPRLLISLIHGNHGGDKLFNTIWPETISIDFGRGV